MGRRLQPFPSRVRDRRCPGHEGRGNQPRCEQSHPGGVRSGESRIESLIQRSSAGRALKGVWPPRRPHREGNLEERAEMGLGRSRWCSWIAPIADVGARRPSPPCESRADCESSTEGDGIDGRRSDSMKSSSFDEAAVEAGRVLPSKGARQRASEAGLRPSRWPNTPQGGSAHRRALDQEPAGPSSAGPLGKPGDVGSHAKAGGSPSSEASPEVTSFVMLRQQCFGRVGGRGSQHPRRKSRMG
jgi:hypothetical protein